MSVTRQALCRLDSAGFRRDAETQYLTAKVHPTRAGVFLYQQADGTVIRELRADAEVFDPESLKSLENKPITNGHPPEMLNSSNTNTYRVGVVTGVHGRADDNLHTVAGAQIEQDKAISDVLAGKQEVSCGYRCDIDDTPGIHPVYGPYDRAQKSIRYNHLSIENRGRAGSGARLRADSKEFLRFDAWEIQADNTATKEDRMSDQETSVKLDAMAAQAREDAKQIGLLENKVQELEGQNQKLQGRVDALETELAEAQKFDLDGAINARLSLIEQAKPHLPENTKFDGLSDQDIKQMVIAAKYDGMTFEDKSAERIDGMFEVAVREPKVVDKTDGFKKAVEAYDSAPVSTADPVTAAYQKQIEKMMGV